jgi:hypothetical protein
MSQQANENVNAVLSVARQAPDYVQMAPELQQAYNQTFIALTANIADTEARAMGIDPNTLSPQQYAYFANKAETMLGTLAQYSEAKGQKAVRTNLSPPLNNNNFVPNPAPAGGAAAVVPDQYASVNHLNHGDAAKQYMASVRGQV